MLIDRLSTIIKFIRRLKMSKSISNKSKHMVYLKTTSDGQTYVGCHCPNGMKTDCTDYCGGGVNMTKYLIDEGIHFASSTLGKTRICNGDYEKYNNLVKTTILKKFSNRDDALAYEKKMIETMHPSMNICFNK